MRERPFLTRHALEQMRLRNVTKAEVDAVLDGPSVSVPSKRNKRARVVWKRIGPRRIALVVGPSKMGGDSVWTVYPLDEED